MTLKTWVALGTVPNDGTGDQPRVAGQKLSNLVSKTYVANAAQFGGTTALQIIQNTINAAVTDGASRVMIPAQDNTVIPPVTMLPYSPATITFNSAVQMTVEGEDQSVYAVQAYGGFGDGTTDDTAAINAADANAPSGAVVKFIKGATHAIPVVSATKFLKLNNAHRWDLNGATVQYTGTTDVTTGSDGGAISMVVILKNGVMLMNGTLDGNTHLALPMSIQGALTGPTEFHNIVIQNTKEANSTWLGIAYTSSNDQTGIPISGARAKNVSGVIIRPNCPVVNASNAIVSHQAATATLIGGSATFGNATGSALVNAGGTEATTFLMTNGTSLGVPQAFSNSGTLIQNASFLDFICYDLGSRHHERYGAVLDVPQRQTFSISGTYTPGWLENAGAQDCNVHVITVSATGAAVSIANPSNSAGISVDRIGALYFTIRNTAAAALSTAVTFTGASYRVTGTVSPNAGQEITVGVMWDQTTGLYKEFTRGTGVNTT